MDAIVVRHFIDFKKIKTIFYDEAIIKSKTIRSTLKINDLSDVYMSDILSFSNPKLLKKYNQQIKLAENIFVKRLKNQDFYSDFY